LYGDIDKVDAFVGMVAERHVAGTEFGPLQLAIWKRQFTDLRDGDRFFYANDQALPLIEQLLHVSYKRTLAQIVTANTGTVTAADVFRAA
jgi:hypothetical protein